MNGNSYENCRCFEFRACVLLSPAAGEDLEPGATCQLMAVIERYSSTGSSYRKLLCDPMRRAFLRSADALRIAAAMAKRFTDTTRARLRYIASPAPAYGTPEPSLVGAATTLCAPGRNSLY